jgi:hypothetical protein
MLASGTQDREFEPGRSRWIFRAKKSTACFPSEGIDWLIGIGDSEPFSLKEIGPLYPYHPSWEPGRPAKAPDGPQVLASRKEEPKCACLIEAKASHRQIMWAEISSSAPHFLQSGLSVSPIKWRCLCRVLPFGGEVKPSAPCRKFAACKRTLRFTWKLGSAGKIDRPFLA